MKNKFEKEDVIKILMTEKLIVFCHCHCHLLPDPGSTFCNHCWEVPPEKQLMKSAWQWEWQSQFWWIPFAMLKKNVLGVQRVGRHIQNQRPELRCKLVTWGFACAPFAWALGRTAMYGLKVSNCPHSINQLNDEQLPYEKGSPTKSGLFQNSQKWFKNIENTCLPFFKIASSIHSRKWIFSSFC